jgi:integrase
MAQTRTKGITVDADGNRIIAKQVLGETIFIRLGRVSQEQAEARLEQEAARARAVRTRGARPRVPFRQAAHRYLKDRLELDSADTIAYHVELLDPWIGDLAIEEVCDETLEPFKKHRLEVDGVSLTTVNRSLEVARAILLLCARSYRHPNRMTWLETAPLITIEQKAARKKARQPYPLSWDEQDLLFAALPEDPNRQMALFKVNTGTREEEVCRLEWDWEVQVPELRTSVFIVPEDLVKNDEPRLIVMNQVARAVLESRRGVHPRYVFTWRGKASKERPPAGEGAPLECMNNTAWQNARKKAAAAYAGRYGRPAPWGFAHARVHDLKHTFGRRLRAAGVPEETRKVLLGHKNGDITTHYSAAELAELIEAVNRIDRSLATPAITLLRVPERKGLAEPLQQKTKAAVVAA